MRRSQHFASFRRTCVSVPSASPLNSRGLFSERQEGQARDTLAFCTGLKQTGQVTASKMPRSKSGSSVVGIFCVGIFWPRSESGPPAGLPLCFEILWGHLGGSNPRCTIQYLFWLACRWHACRRFCLVAAAPIAESGLMRRAAGAGWKRLGAPSSPGWRPHLPPQTADRSLLSHRTSLLF